MKSFKQSTTCNGGRCSVNAALSYRFYNDLVMGTSEILGVVGNWYLFLKM